MKSASKILLAASLPAVLLQASCSLDDAKNEQTLNEEVNNLIIPADADEDVQIQSKCAYSFTYDYVNGNITVTTGNLVINGKTTGFSSIMPFTQYSYGSSRLMKFSGGSAILSGDFSGDKVTDLRGVTSEEYFLYYTAVPIFPMQSMNIMPMIQYNAAGYSVSTFASNTYFAGTTKTSFNRGGQVSSFESTDPIYRVYFSTDFKKANVVIYNVKFAAEMPNALAAVVLKDLDVEFGRYGYKISGSEVEPQMLEGSELVPYPDRIFNSFELKTTSADMESVTCNYVCASIFNGEFSGRCIPSTSMPE